MDRMTEEQTDSSKFILFSIILVTILVIIVLGLSFAVFKSAESSGGVGDENEDKTLSGEEDSSYGDRDGEISMTYTESTNGISLTNALPVSDAVGKSLKGNGEYFDFTINSKFTKKASVTYEIAAIKDKTSTISDRDIKLYLEQQKSGTYESVMEPTSFQSISEDSDIGSPKGSMILKKVKKKSSGTDNYRLRMWINETSNVDMNKSYTVKINVYGKAS